MPGATTASDVLFCAAIDVKLRMIPQTVPNRPTKGATAPTVARILRRSPSRSSSAATAAFIRVASRSRVPERSIVRLRVERRHSSMPAVRIEALGNFSLPRFEWNASMSSVAQKSFSNRSVALLMRFRRIEWVKMIAQVQMLAASRPSITNLTTMSA